MGNAEHATRTLDAREAWNVHSVFASRRVCAEYWMMRPASEPRAVTLDVDRDH